MAAVQRALGLLTQGAVELQRCSIFSYEVLDVHAYTETGVSCNTRERVYDKTKNNDDNKNMFLCSSWRK